MNTVFNKKQPMLNQVSRRYKNRSRRDLRCGKDCSYLLRYLLALLILTACGVQAYAASDKAALVIGNGSYQYAQYLPNPVNDAGAVAKQLKTLGFDVMYRADVSDAELKQAVRRFSSQLKNNTTALFYYAGHGMQQNGRNYLIPVNANIKASYEIEFSGVDLNIVLSALNDAQPKLSIVMIDACRDNPFEKQMLGAARGASGRGGGLAPQDSGSGTIVSFATEPGRTAVDGHGKHSPYTTALLKMLNVPGLSVQEMLNELGLEVVSLTAGTQKPWYASTPIARFCFADCDSSIDASQMRAVNALKQAIEGRRLGEVQDLVELGKAQRDLLEGLFGAYSMLSVETLISTQPQKRKTQISVTVKITEATNHMGNRVIPSEKWQYMTFNMK